MTNAERAVVGASLLDPNMIREAVEHCSPADFRDPNLGGGHASAPPDSPTPGHQPTITRSAPTNPA